MSTLDDTPVRLRAVVCDDDALVRSVISRVARLAGVEVVAEADTPEDAVDLLARSGAEELILDLALTTGHGESALDLIRARSLPCRTVVFSAYAGDPARLLAAGATDVVEKPDFARLEEVLTLHAGGASHDSTDRRRNLPGQVLMPMPAFVSPSGILPPSELSLVLQSLQAGDSVVVVSLDGLRGLVSEHGGVIASDHLLAVGRVAKEVLRAQDRVAVDAEGALVVTLPRCGHEMAAKVFERIRSAWQRKATFGSLRAGHVTVSEHTSGKAAHVRASAALADALSTGRTLVGA